MKTKICMLILLFLPTWMQGQNSSLERLDVNLNSVKYPHEVHYLNLHFQHQDLKMAYMDIQSQSPNNKNIVLLHGKNFNGAYWETTIRELVKNGFRVIVPDQIGFGKSTKPLHFQYSFQIMAHTTKILLDRLGISRTAVLGHSMGGMLATRFALMYPEMTQKLILENPIGLEDYLQMVPYQTVGKWFNDELAQTYEKLKEYQLRYYYDNKWKPEYDRWLNLLAGWTLDDDYELIAWNAALTTDMIYTHPVVHEFHLVKSPTLLIIGTRDRTALGKSLAPPEVQKTMGLYNQLGKKTQEKIPNSQLVELEGIGHLPHIESFGQFIEPLLKFLKE